MKRVIKNCVIILLLFMVPTTIFASSYQQQLKDLEQQQKDNKSEINKSEEIIKSLDKEIQEIVRRVQQLDIQIDEYNNKIGELQQQQNDKEKQIEVINQELEVAKQKEEKYFNTTKERIKVMYEQGDSAYAEVLLGSKDLSDFLTRVEYVNALVEYDTNMIEELQLIRDDIEDKEIQLEEDKEQIVALKKENTLQQKSLKDIQSTKEKEMLILGENKSVAQSELNAKEKELAKIEKSIDSIKSKLVYAGGKMTWPTSNHYITCPFGNRIHPVTKKPSYHTGIDIGVGMGTSVKAASSGEVTYAGYSSVWGKYIYVDHGSGYVSIYAHNSKLLVKKGDKVKGGQTISKSGNTGLSTGPHLHFGIRKNGKWIPPLTMLK
ncbi:metalloendopeptidase [Vallitalea longa]|uniref:Metalloendopeptidase n=1 Tax=Vallitalea longa TaxID=2936439 RepID=A0A9W5YAN1_9FIRM|nr:peptidoglycan DD-metalloendopeptidase family protein [Vallitalea longa]GKX30457.1 metalloendopeptidase [Vallitalea longa]